MVPKTLIKYLPRERNNALKNTTKLIALIVSTIKTKLQYNQMVEQKNNGMGENLIGKKRMLPSELSHKFSSKDDFLNFFSKTVSKFLFLTLIIQLQLYTPPKLMCNKDFLRQIISGEKELIERKHIQTVDVPNFDELSVSNLWPRLK